MSPWNCSLTGLRSTDMKMINARTEATVWTTAGGLHDELKAAKAVGVG